MQYKVEVPVWVYEQMTAIAAHISDELHAPQVAENVLNDLETAILSLDMFPERIPFARDKSLKAYVLHCMVVRKYLIYFQIDEAIRQVNVVAVIYGRRDQMARLAEIMPRDARQ